MERGSEPVDDEELLYRRVPASLGWYSPTTGVISSEAFGPHKNRDVSGLSVTRAKYKSIEEAARGRPGKSYYVVVLRAGANSVVCLAMPAGTRRAGILRVCGCTFNWRENLVKQARDSADVRRAHSSTGRNCSTTFA